MRPFTTLFFDLDGTLYPNTNGLWEIIQARMEAYMQHRLGLSPKRVPALRRAYSDRYGTTLRGLQASYDVDQDDYLAYVHDLPLEKFLRPDHRVRAILESLPQEKWIFTNADDRHAGRVLSALQLDGCFTGVIDVRAMEYACKPEPQAYRRALARAGSPDARNCVLFDDSPRNLVAAAELGFYTVLVGMANSHPPIHIAMASLAELPQKMKVCLASFDPRE